MSLNILTAEAAIHQLAEFHTIIDARSEDEYAEDHLPGAVNWPTLFNAERREVGTTYKQISSFEARKRGAAMAARNISEHIHSNVLDKPKDWRPLAYCWRGGKRSGSLALVLDQIGFQVTLLEGGYKAFRAAIVKNIDPLVSKLDFQVICGTTGSGKTRLLHALRRQGAQVLDLEALARHRSSVLGAIPGVEQPTQKGFDTLVWNELRQFRANEPVFVESESKKVGNVSIPAALVDAMRSSPCINLILPEAQRVALLLEDYAYFANDLAHFCKRLDVLTALRGKAQIDEWKHSVNNGQVDQVVAELLARHYDPVYLQSMERNFEQFKACRTLKPQGRSTQEMDRAALALLSPP